MDKKTKCFSVNLAMEQVEKLKNLKENSGKSQNKILSESVESGLQKFSFLQSGKKLYLVKVRINTDLLMELGQKLQNNKLDTSMMLFTYCSKDDPEVGVSLWMADDKKHFDKLFSPHKYYYKDVIDIQEVVLPEESMKLLLSKM